MSYSVNDGPIAYDKLAHGGPEVTDTAKDSRILPGENKLPQGITSNCVLENV
jgi:hypothetical protein